MALSALSLPIARTIERPKTRPIRAPSRHRISAWLDGALVVDSCGNVASWHNSKHPGYAYPEAAALWLMWVAWRLENREPAPAANRVLAVAKALIRTMSDAGAIGRGDRRYLFDTCLALHALIRLERAGLPLGALPIDPTKRALQRFLHMDSPVLPIAGTRPRWSERWGSFLQRGTALLCQAALWKRDAELVHVARRLRERALASRRAENYTHALIYATEGEFLHRALGEAPSTLCPSTVAQLLVTLQRQDGGIPGWTDGAHDVRLDSTAQAVRLWSVLDRDGFDHAINRALAFLCQHQSVHGALPYAAHSEDLNTWVTLFTDQATAWALKPPNNPAWI